MTEDAHWNPGNMIYGDNQKAVRYVTIDGAMVLLDKGNEIVDIDDNSAMNEAVALALTNKVRLDENKWDDVDLKTIYAKSIARIPNVNVITQSTNLYAYCKNNSIMYDDPSGNDVGTAAEIFNWSWSTGGIVTQFDSLMIGPVDAVGVGIIIGGTIIAGLTLAYETISDGIIFYKEHASKARSSTKNKHQEAETRRNCDKGGEKGDARRRPNPNKRRP